MTSKPNQPILLINFTFSLPSKVKQTAEDCPPPPAHFYSSVVSSADFFFIIVLKHNLFIFATILLI